MKVYIASSWKNASVVLDLAYLFRSWGHEVDAFPDTSTGRYVFNWHDILHKNQPFDAKSLQNHPASKRAFREDRKFLDWCDCCLLLLPAGNSSHLEGGYAKGKNKLLIIFAFRGFEPAHLDVMCGFADLLTDNLDEVKSFLQGAIKSPIKEANKYDHEN